MERGRVGDKEWAEGAGSERSERKGRKARRKVKPEGKARHGGL